MFQFYGSKDTYLIRKSDRFIGSIVFTLIKFIDCERRFEQWLG